MGLGVTLSVERYLVGIAAAALVVAAALVIAADRSNSTP